MLVSRNKFEKLQWYIVFLKNGVAFLIMSITYLILEIKPDQNFLSFYLNNCLKGINRIEKVSAKDFSVTGRTGHDTVCVE